MLNIHLSGGHDMAIAAMNAKKECQSNSKLIGVTVLTSLTDDDCLRIYGCKRSDQLKRLKDIALDANVDGFVCSPYDIDILRVKNKLFVKSDSGIEFEVFNIYGKIVVNKIVSETGEAMLDVSNLAPGYYGIKITYPINNKTENYKFIKLD